MEILINIVLSIIVVAAGVGIINLGENETYHRKVNGVLKNIIALILGLFSAFFFNSFINILYSISRSFFYGEGIMDFIMQLASKAFGIGGAVSAGIIVYYSLCNISIWGDRIAYGLYAILSIICIFDIYYLFISDIILDGVLYIISVAAGLAVLVYESNKVKDKMKVFD